MSYIDKLSSHTVMGKFGGRKFILDYCINNGNLHKKFKVIHVTGTCGKGSTSSMIAKGLEMEGYKVGLFTSPHLLKLNERIRINSELISDQDLNSLIKKYMDLIPELSFSEYLMLVSIDYFANQEVDYVVYEVFVGGEHDPTNIFDSCVTVLTSIGLDHKNLLGNSIDDILSQKLGILRKDIPLFIRFENQIVLDKVQEIGAILKVVERLEQTNLLGNYQKENAGLAYEILKYLNVSNKNISLALMRVEWRGRLQYIKPNVLLDCAHNELGMENLKEYLQNTNFKNIYYLFALSNNKNYESFRKEIINEGELVLTKPDMFKIADPKSYSTNELIIEDVEEAFNYLYNKLENNDLLVVCGSMYLVSEVLKLNLK